MRNVNGIGGSDPRKLVTEVTASPSCMRAIAAPRRLSESSHAKPCGEYRGYAVVQIETEPKTWWAMGLAVSLANGAQIGGAS